MEENRGRNHGIVQHSEARFKRAENLMRVALNKAQKFDTKSNTQDELAAKDNKVHNTLIREADLASKSIGEEEKHTKKIELVRCVGYVLLKLGEK